MKILISALLLLHGLIVAGQSAGSFGSAIPNEIPNPSFVSWYPVNMGRSWVFSSLGWGRSLFAYRIGGLLWLAGGIMLVAAGLSILDILVPVDWWRDLAVAGSAISLFMLLVYFHPLMVIGAASSLAVLIALVWFRWPAVNVLS
jgi:hypothetical protein